MENKELKLVDHLEELRWRIIISALAFVGFFIIGFIYVDDIYKWFVRSLDVKLMVLGPSDIIWIYFKLASIVAISGTIPVLALQIWLFVRPALNPNERRITLAYIPALFILFLIGLSFGYFVIFPMVFNFLVKLGGDIFITNFTVEKYFSFLMNLTLPLAGLFELPIAVMFLTSIGLINPFALAKIRKYAYFILVILATVITPPDLVTEVIVALPLLLLYEISISLSKIIYRKRIKKQEEVLIEA